MSGTFAGLGQQPPQELSGLDQLGRALSGFGAGVQGRGAQFAESIQNQDDKRRAGLQELDDKRRDALLQDSRTVLQTLNSGNTQGALDLLDNRLGFLQQAGANPQDTQEIRDKIASGNAAGAIADLEILDRGAVNAGLLKPREQPSFVGRQGEQAIVRMPDGTFQAQEIGNLNTKQQPDKVLEVKDGNVVLQRPDGSVFAQPLAGFVQQAESVKLSDLNNINKEVGNLVKDANLIRSAATALQTLSKTKSPTDQLAAVFKLMKALDPTSVVREGEQQQARSVGGPSDALIGFVNQIKGQGSLPPKVFEDMVRTAERLANQSIDDVTTTVDGYLTGFGSQLKDKTKGNLRTRIPEKFAEQVQPIPIGGPLAPQQTQQPAPQAAPATGGFKILGRTGGTL